MFGFRHREWRRAHKDEIAYLKELLAVGCLLALIMCALTFMAEMDDDPTDFVAVVQTDAPPETVGPSLSSVKKPESPVGKDGEGNVAVPQSSDERPAAGTVVNDGALDGLDPLATPEIFDRYDELIMLGTVAMDALGEVVAHVPSELNAQTQRRETPAPRVHVVIDKSEHTLTLFRGDEVVRQYGVAVGKNPGNKARPGDLRTPEGDFPVQQIHNAAYWVHDFDDGNGIVEGAYGPLFIRLLTPPWKGIGIHGTHDPDSIGTNATEGCVRMQNDDLLELADAIEIGMTVTIR